MKIINKFLAIIPARGGSKRLPRKNLLHLAGKPLIAWSIEAARNSKYIDKVVVTSDDDEILQVAKEYLAETIKRPAELATDSASSFEVIQHAIEQYSAHDYIVLLQPTSPLRTTKHINQAIELLKFKQADAIISLCETDHSPLWSNILPSDDNLNNFLCQDVLNKRSQDLEKYYRINGAIYICKITKLLEQKNILIKDNIYAYKMDRQSSVDIDEKIDFILADLLAKNSISDEI